MNLYSLLDLDTLAVVPIVTAAGSALLPAIGAAAATVVGLIFKPKELLATCKRRPLVPISLILSVFIIWGGISLFGSMGSGQGRKRADTAGTANPASQTDWTRVALEIIRQQKSGPAAPALETPPPTTSNALDAAIIYRGGPERRGWDHGASPKKMELAWRYYPTWVDDDASVIEDTDAMILSTPLVANGLVYGASCLMDPPDTFGSLFCLDATTGQQRWIAELAGDADLKGFFSSPALSADGKSIVVGQGLHPDTNCLLVCFDAENGDLRWSAPTELHIESSPAIEGNLVVVGCGAIENPSTHKPISHPGYVLAVDLDTGTERWRYDLADPESSPVIVDGIVYIGSGFNGKAIVALRSESDEELKSKGLDRLIWRVESDYPVTGAVTVSGDTVLVGGGNGDFVYSADKPAGMVLAIDKATGALKWNSPLPDSVLGALASDGKRVICPVANGEVHALDITTGEALWTVAANGRSPVLTGSAFTDDSVYVVSKDGYLIRIDASDGSVQEKLYINNPQRPGASGLAISSPTVANGRIYLGSETGGLRCYTGSAQ